MKAGAPKEFLLNEYCITDRMYNLVIDNEPEVIVKVKSPQKQVPILIFRISIVLYFFSSLSTATGQLRCDRHCLSHHSCLFGEYR